MQGAPSFSSRSATVRRPGRTIVIAAAVMLLPVVGFALVAAGASTLVRSLVGVLAVSEAFVLLAFATLMPRVFWGAGKPGETHLEVDERGLVIDGRIAVRRRDVASVSVATGADGRAHVVVAGNARLSTIDVALDDEETARRLATALDRDAALPSYFVETEPLGASPAWRRFARRAAVAIPLFAFTTWFVTAHLRAVVPVGYVPLAIGFVFALARREAPTRAVFGVDGVALRRRGALEFVPFAAIASVELVPRGAAVVLASGERVVFKAAGVDASADAQGEALGRTLLAAHADVVDHQGHADAAIESRLARGRRAARDWMAELRSLRARAAQGYRDLALGEDRLLAIVESPAAPSSARAAAAVLVAPHGSESARERIRRAALRSAAPGLRDLLEAAASDADEPVLERLIDAQN